MGAVWVWLVQVWGLKRYMLEEKRQWERYVKSSFVTSFVNVKSFGVVHAGV